MRFDQAELRVLLDRSDLISLEEIISKKYDEEKVPQENESIDRLESYLMFTLQDME